MISESSREIAFQYSKGYLIYKLTIALLIYLLAVFYFLLAFIYSLISGIFLLGLDKFLITLGLGLAFWWSFSGISTYINSFNEFRVSEIGLRVKIFNFWFIWKDIAWIDILWMQEYQVASYEKEKRWIIAMKRMTVWHKFRGKQLGFKGIPIVEFNSNLRDVDEFIRLLRERINESNRI